MSTSTGGLALKRCLAVMPVQHRLKPDATESRATGFADGRGERRVGKLRFCNKPAGGHRPATWWAEREKQGTAERSGEGREGPGRVRATATLRWQLYDVGAAPAFRRDFKIESCLY